MEIKGFQSKLTEVARIRTSKKFVGRLPWSENGISSKPTSGSTGCVWFISGGQPGLGLGMRHMQMPWGGRKEGMGAMRVEKAHSLHQDRAY